MATLSLKTRVKKLENNTLSLVELYQRAVQQIPPERAQAAGVRRFLTSQAEITTDDIQAFVAWYEGNYHDIHKVFDQLRPDWYRLTECDDSNISKLADGVMNGLYTLEELSTLFPDVLPQVAALVDVRHHAEQIAESLTD